MIKLLLVENDPDISFYFQESLKKRFLVVDIASRGDDAIEKATQHEPDVVLMDIILDGEMNGIEAARSIMKQCDAAVIFVTATNDEDLIRHANLPKPYSIILKPVNFKELYTLIDRLTT